MSVDLTQLRYPVVCWTGRTPLHQIRALAIAFPQAGLYADRSQQPDLAKQQREDETKKHEQLPLICSIQHPPHAFLMSGSLTGELAHWYIPSYRADIPSQRRACGLNHAVPRAMLLRQGAAACTALTYCRDGLVQMFCAGTSEGFLTLWSVGGGRCIRSELVLPFAPAQILFYQRYNPLAHGRTIAQRSPSPPSGSPNPAAATATAAPLGSGASSPGPPASTSRRPTVVHLRNYLLCCSDDSRDVYVVELPSLALLAILQHRAPVLSMALVPPSFSKQRTPYLVTVTAHHHVCMWDLSRIEKKHDEKKRIRLAQQLQAQRARPGSAYSITVASPLPNTSMSGEQLPALPNLAHPVSSLASNSASIVTPGSATHPSSASSHSSAPAVPLGSLIVKWDEPTQSFMLPLPPLSFTLSPLFVPIALCISPCGSRCVVVFPYAFMSVNMRTFEVEGDIRSMEEEVRRWRRVEEEKDEEKSDDGHDWPTHRPRTDCISQHASWAGAGFLTTPSVASAGKPSTSEQPQPHAQHLVLWNVTGEFIWVYTVTPAVAPSAASSPSNGTPQTPQRKMHPSHSSAGPQASTPSPAPLKRSLSTTRITARASLPASERSVGEGVHAAEAPELGTTSSGGRQLPGAAVDEAEFRLVARCVLVDPRAGASSPSHPLSPKIPHAYSSSPSSVPTPLVTVQLSGHTIFAGTNEGEIFQWHIPICTQANLFAHVEGEPKTYAPTHVSRMSDAFTHAHHTSQPTTPTGAGTGTSSPSSGSTLPSPLPQFPRVVSHPGLLIPGRNHSPAGGLESPRASPRRPLSPSLSTDPTTASTMLVDPWHEALFLVVGYASGALQIYNMLSIGSANYRLAIRHQGMVTCMLNVLGWVEACMLATGGVDGRIMVLEMSTGALQQTLYCHAPVISLHRPSSVGEEALGPFYKGANSNLLFAYCADSTLRGFSLATSECLFTGRGLDSPIKALFRPMWAIVADAVLCQTKAGTVYVFSMTSEHAQQVIELDAGANAFLQKHDLIVPGSQLSILAHRLYQMKHLRKKPLPALNSSPNTSPPMSRSVSTAELKQQMDGESQASPSGSESPDADGVDGKLSMEDGRFSSGLQMAIPSATAMSNASPLPPATAYDLAPPPLSRARTTMLVRGTTPNATPSRRSSISSGTPTPNLRSLLQRQRSSGSNLVDSSFQREIYRLNQMHLVGGALEKEAEEGRRHVGPAHGGGHHQHHSALNPPVHQAASARPTTSTIINPNAAAPVLAAPTAGGQPLRSMYVHAPAAAPSPPPPAAPVIRSPIAYVDVVTAPGSSASPLQHLHANVYVWNVHQLLPYFAAHASALVAFAKRNAAIAAAAADPDNQSLQATAKAARDSPIPPTYYVIRGLLSTLFDWNSHSPIDGLLRTKLCLHPSTPAISFASLSDNSQSMTLLLPSQSHEHLRWSIDPDMTARHLMAIVTATMTLMDKSEPNSPAIPWLAQVLQYHTTTIPRAFRLYSEGDLNVLGMFALNVHRPVHTAARLLISQSLDRMPPGARLALAVEHGQFFEYALPAQRMLFQPEFSLSPADLVASGSIMAVCENGPGIGYVSDEEMLHCSLLCWLGLYELKQQRKSAQGIQLLRASDLASLAGVNECISAFHTKSQFLTNTLLRMIAWPVSTELEYVRCALACDLLAKGLLVFRHHITEPLLLLRRLYSLTQHPHELLSKAAMHALLDSGKIAPTHFITCIGREAMNYRSTAAARQGALMCVVGLIKKHPLALARSLPATVRMIVGTLDPAEPTLRKTLLQASTSALYALAAAYPQVSFHQATQRYAVGTANGPQSVIIVYDLRTATKWRILEGHTGEVHAVSFHPKGLSLASYSATENPPSVRVWSTGGGGFFSGLLGMEGKCTKSWPILPCVKKEVTAPSKLNIQQPQQQRSTTKASSTGVSGGASVGGSASSKSSATISDDDDSSDEVADVDEPADEEDGADDAQPKSLAPRAPIRPKAAVASTSTGRNANGSISVVGASPAARFSLEELIAVKLMWITEIAIKLRREDGSMADFSL